MRKKQKTAKRVKARIDYGLPDQSPYTPEQHLWAAVINTALLDLGIDVERTRAKTAKTHHLKSRLARRFFEFPDGHVGDFNYCCDAVGIDPKCIIRVIKPYLR